MSQVDETKERRTSESKSSYDGDNKNDRTISESQSFDEGEGEGLDPRVKNELEELNAATDGINHLETELNEAQALFNQSIEDSTSQLKQLHQKLGKCVDKARPYYEALKTAKNARTELHNASLTYELAQTRHFNAKKDVLAAEKKVTQSIDGKLDPVLQELLNKVTTDVMEAALAMSDAEKEHNIVNTDFNKKHAYLQQTYNKLKNDVGKSRPFFELKSTLNKQLEVEKQRVAKIQEGIQVSKNAYSQTLHKLNLISEDIHKTRTLKQSGLTVPSLETPNSIQPTDLEITRAVSISSYDTRSLNSDIYDDNTTPGLMNEDTCSSTSNDIEEINLHLDKLAENTASFESKPDVSKDSDGINEKDEALEESSQSKGCKKSSGMVIKVGDAMKGMQDGCTSPFECITSHSLQYSNRISSPLEDCIDGNIDDDVTN